MKVLWCVIALAIFVPLFSFGQSTIQTGFAVVTPVSDSGLGLNVSELFSEQSGGTLFQATVLPSPPVTLTSLVVNSDPVTGINTGIAIVNPNNIPAIVTLSLRNQQGSVIATRTLTVGGHQQASRFMTELFLGEPALGGPFSGLLLISSDASVGVLGLAFHGPSFTTLPMATQLAATNIVTSVNNTFLPTTIATTTGTTAVTTSPVPSTIVQIPSTFPNLAPTQPAVGVVTPLTGNPTTTTSNVQVTTFGSPVASAFSQPVVAPVAIFPEIVAGVGGPGALVLPQVAAGGGWFSQITISNTSADMKVVRVDFFNPVGAPLILPFGSTLQDIVVPPGGVVTLSTAM